MRLSMPSMHPTDAETALAASEARMHDVTKDFDVIMEQVQSHVTALHELADLLRVVVHNAPAMSERLQEAREALDGDPW
jgi:hypothetical protein